MRRRKFKGYADQQQTAYIEQLIVSSDPENKKNGLQLLCQTYRLGLQVRRVDKFQVYLLGLLHDQNPKIKRWTLNTLAHIGQPEHSLAIVEAIKRNSNEPDIIYAGVGALAALLSTDEVRAELIGIDLPISGPVLLAAAQQTDAFAGSLNNTRINIENAEADELRLGLLLVGLDKAPPHLFSSSMVNQKVIGQLNTHDDHLVAQYSVWATCENPNYSLSDLSVSLKDIEYQPENVRRFIYQLAAKSNEVAKEQYELFLRASEDRSLEARSGLAVGLRHVYFNSLEQIVLTWFPNEEHEPIRQRLLEHMAAHSEHYAGYATPVVEHYRAASENSLPRLRLEAAAQGLPLFGELKSIALKAADDDLFSKYGRTLRSTPRQLSSTVDASVNPGNDVRILIIAALSKEAAAVKATFDKQESISGLGSDRTIYTLGTYIRGEDHRRVILAASGMGKVNASTLCTNALRSFSNIEHIVMVGIAGGCPNATNPTEHVRLGDIVFSDNSGILEYDHVKQLDAGSEIRATSQLPSATLLGIANDIVSDAMLNENIVDNILIAAIKRLGAHYERPAAATDVLHDSNGTIDHPDEPTRPNNFPKIMGGGIGSADTLQKSAHKRDSLRDKFKIRAIEMEASGLQGAAWVGGKDIFVVRGICDYCDEYKNDDWQNYAAVSAASFARALVERMPLTWLSSLTK